MSNRVEYNAGLRQRSGLTVWMSEGVLGLWSAPRRTTRSGQRKYSDLAVEICLMPGMVFKQPLRRTQGQMCSIAGLLGVEIAIPDFSTLSRRSSGLALRRTRKPGSGKPVHLVMDSTGLRISGEGDWLEEKHKTKRKLHFGLDLVSGKIVCSDLTKGDVDDPTVLPELLDQVDGSVALSGRWSLRWRTGI